MKTLLSLLLVAGSTFGQDATESLKCPTGPCLIPGTTNQITWPGVPLVQAEPSAVIKTPQITGEGAGSIQLGSVLPCSADLNAHRFTDLASAYVSDARGTRRGDPYEGGGSIHAYVVKYGDYWQVSCAPGYDPATGLPLIADGTRIPIKELKEESSTVPTLQMGGTPFHVDAFSDIEFTLYGDHFNELLRTVPGTDILIYEKGTEEEIIRRLVAGIRADSAREVAQSKQDHEWQLNAMELIKVQQAFIETYKDTADRYREIAKVIQKKPQTEKLAIGPNSCWKSTDGTVTCSATKAKLLNENELPPTMNQKPLRGTVTGDPPASAKLPEFRDPTKWYPVQLNSGSGIKLECRGTKTAITCRAIDPTHPHAQR